MEDFAEGKIVDFESAELAATRAVRRAAVLAAVALVAAAASLSFSDFAERKSFLCEVAGANASPAYCSNGGWSDGVIEEMRAARNAGASGR